jgi:hypothetical protein
MLMYSFRINARSFSKLSNPFLHKLFIQGQKEWEKKQSCKTQSCKAAALFVSWMKEVDFYKVIYHVYDEDGKYTKTEADEIRQNFRDHYFCIMDAFHTCSTIKYKQQIIDLAIAPKDTK